MFREPSVVVIAHHIEEVQVVGQSWDIIGILNGEVSFGGNLALLLL